MDVHHKRAAVILQQSEQIGNFACPADKGLRGSLSQEVAYTAHHIRNRLSGVWARSYHRCAVKPPAQADIYNAEEQNGRFEMTCDIARVCDRWRHDRHTVFARTLLSTI
jgi:hypothetical protein